MLFIWILSKCARVRQGSIRPICFCSYLWTDLIWSKMKTWSLMVLHQH